MMYKRLMALAQVYFLEMVREKFVVVAVFIALLLVGISLVLGSMSFEEHRRLLLHFGFLAVHLTSLSIVLFLGSYAIPKEIERQTCLLVLVRPLSRTIFFFGKLLGLGFLATVCGLSLSGVLLLLLGGNVPIANFALAYLGIWAESFTLLGFVMMCSLVLRPAVALLAGVALFLIGHWQPDLFFFAEKSKNPIFQSLSELAPFVFPQFFRLNYRSVNLIDTKDLWDLFPSAALHHFAWLGLYVFIAALVFRRRDLV